MNTVSKISFGGRITIPRSMRKLFDLQVGDYLAATWQCRRTDYGDELHVVFGSKSRLGRFEALAKSKENRW